MKVLLTTDGTPTATHALNEATRLLALKGADVLLVSVLDPGQHTGGNLDAKSDLEKGLGLLRERGVEARAEVLRGTFAEAIVAKAEEMGADVIVVGSERSSRITKFLLGSVSAEVVKRFERAVLVIPSSHRENAETKS